MQITAFIERGVIFKFYVQVVYLLSENTSMTMMVIFGRLKFAACCCDFSECNGYLSITDHYASKSTE